MIALLVVLTPIAIIYSIAILPSGIASIAASMAAEKPYLTSCAYLAGKFIPMFVFGLLVAIGLDTAFEQLTERATDIWRNPGTPAVVLQLVIGAVMALFGYRFATAPPESSPSASSGAVTPGAVFSLGAGLTVLSLPGNFLYFAAIDQILRAGLAVPGMVIAILYYNLVVLLPLGSIVLIRRLFGSRADPLFDAVAAFIEQRGKRLLLFGVVGIGVILVVDAVGWFTGLPLLPSYIR